MPEEGYKVPTGVGKDSGGEAGSDNALKDENVARNESAVNSGDALNGQNAVKAGNLNGSDKMQAQGEKAKNKLMPAVIVLAILAAAGMAFGGVALAQNFAKEDRIKELEAKLEGQEKPGTDTEKPTEPEGEDKPADDLFTKEEILAGVPEGLAFSKAKCLNCAAEMENGVHSSISYNNGQVFLAAINSETGAGFLSVFWDNLKDLGLVSDIDKSGLESFDNLELSGRATDVKVIQFGQAYGYETAFFLMEDGTVEYIPIIKALKENNVKSYGKLPGVTDVIKFYQGNSHPKNSPTGGGDQGFAQRADGDYYELYSLVEAAGGFEL